MLAAAPGVTQQVVRAGMPTPRAGTRRWSITGAPASKPGGAVPGGLVIPAVRQDTRLPGTPCRRET